MDVQIIIKASILFIFILGLVVIHFVFNKLKQRQDESFAQLESFIEKHRFKNVIVSSKSFCYVAFIHYWWLSSRRWETLVIEDAKSDKEAFSIAFNLIKRTKNMDLYADFSLIKVLDNIVIPLKQSEDMEVKISDNNDPRKNN